MATTQLPDWLCAPDPPTPTLSKEAAKLSHSRFESVFPRVMDMIAEGYEMTKALSELPVEINSGAFLRWVKKDPIRESMLRESEELRTGVYADKALDHALGKYEMEEVARSKLVVDTYKWLMGADHKKKYGDTRTVEVSGGISITGAIAQANQRLEQIQQMVIDDAITEVVIEPPPLDNTLNDGEDDH